MKNSKVEGSLWSIEYRGRCPDGWPVVLAEMFMIGHVPRPPAEITVAKRMTNLGDLLNEIISGDTLFYGTVLCHKSTLQIWWSPVEWKSPNDGLKAQPGKWICVGQSTWFGSDDQKRMLVGLVDELGDDMPNSPGEWVYFDNRPHLTTSVE